MLILPKRRFQGGCVMRRLSRYIGLLLMAGVLFTPVLSTGCSTGESVYDESHGDSHRWDDHEEVVYKGYLSDNHKDYKPYNQLNKDDQKSYWDWRHNNPNK
jgi:hypothetical protein